MRVRLRITLGLVLASVAAAGLWHIRAEAVAARWSAMTQKTTAVRAALAALPVKRPVLYGEATAGNAFDDYDAARRALPADGQKLWFEYRLAAPESVGSCRAAYVAAHRAALAHLKRGTHRELAQPRMDLGRRADANPYFLDARWLTVACVLQAAEQLDAGDTVSAAESLLDGMQFARDLAQSPKIIEHCAGAAMLITASALELVDFDGLPTAALQRLEIGMERLDLNLDLPWRALEGDLVLSAQQRHGESSWRFGWSQRLTVACSVLERASILRATRDALTNDSQIAEEGLLAAYAASANPITQEARSGLENLFNYWDAIARIQKWRMAIAHRLRGACNALPDPRGGKIEHRVALDYLFLRSKAGSSHNTLQVRIAAAKPAK